MKSCKVSPDFGGGGGLRGRRGNFRDICAGCGTDVYVNRTMKSPKVVQKLLLRIGAASHRFRQCHCQNCCIFGTSNHSNVNLGSIIS
ncbi:hypothetical protein AB205_0128880 [Aquarana catesbeiana]|uniref:Uncharacterized protein n=1 Tax=Aquarana catesbeiana TaxID=8400 RepID=A0A2G9PBI6_AQUCT|nr:hypothetical protein AB205_0128880 [Aquarana catesbeiana]